jgi:hypothetical protein
VLLHRDFQSSNVLLRNSKMAIIDFQGMRMGPAAYDLGSLLCDPYVIINNFERQQLIGYYDAHVGPEHKVPEFFDWAATQRLLQAMGAFGRLSATGFKSFEKYIPRAAMLLAECAGNCGLEMIVDIARKIEQVSGRRNI